MINENGISWAISSTEWNRSPVWQKEQLKQDRKIGLNRYYKIISSESSTDLVFRFDFTKPFLLPNTPSDWKLPEPYKFNIRADVNNLIYKIGKSYPLFKFVNKEAKLSYKDFKFHNWEVFTKIQIRMQITLIKNESELKENQNEVTEIKLKLPTIEEQYSSYIIHNKYPNFGGNTANYYQSIYFPLMKRMGFADSTKYEVYEDKFNNQHNHAWDYLLVDVKYTIEN